MTSTNKHHMSPRLAPTFTPHRPQEVLRGMLLALQRCEGEAERKNRYLLLLFESKKEEDRLLRGCWTARLLLRLDCPHSRIPDKRWTPCMLVV